MKNKIVIAGGSGFLGKALSSHFKNQGILVTVFTRGKTQLIDGVNYVHWDGKTIGEWMEHMNQVDVLINLTGKSVDCRYTKVNKKEILDSRVNATRILGEAIQEVDQPPRVWLNASTATIYRASYDNVMTEEDGEIGNDFSMDVAKAWEASFIEPENPKTRKVALRISLVLGKNEGVLPVLSKLTKLGLGGYHGNGKQKFACIHIEDLINAVQFIIDNENIEGPVICSAPTHIDNKNFMKAFRKAMGVSFGLPASKIMLKMGAVVMGTEPELILKSRYVSPKKLLDAGFQFKFANIDKALADLL